jgi:hypothetical protein
VSPLVSLQQATKRVIQFNDGASNQDVPRSRRNSIGRILRRVFEVITALPGGTCADERPLSSWIFFSARVRISEFDYERLDGGSLKCLLSASWWPRLPPKSRRELRAD